MISVSVVYGSRILVWVERGMAVVTFGFFSLSLPPQKQKREEPKEKKKASGTRWCTKKRKTDRGPKRRGDMRQLRELFVFFKKRNNALRECNDKQEAPPSKKKKILR